MVALRRADQQSTLLAAAHPLATGDGDVHPLAGDLKDLAAGWPPLCALQPQLAGRRYGVGHRLLRGCPRVRADQRHGSPLEVLD